MEDRILITRAMMPTYEEYIEAIKPLWDSHWITNMGTYHNQFESELRNYLEVPQVSLMVNGHMSLELVIQAFGFPEGSEVITTPFTFVSTTHAIVRNRLTPVFCDVKQEDGTIDEEKIEELITEKTVAIIPVHVYGNICNVEEIQRIADKHGLKVIYDAAHAFGEKYKGIGIGNFGDASIFSFHATKVFNTIEGGAVTFQERALYEKLYNLKNFGIRGEETVEEIGANAKMNEFCAIMGLCNLKKVDEIFAERELLFQVYSEKLKHIKGLTSLLPETNNLKRNYSYYPVIVDDNIFCKSRDELYATLRENNIYARKYFYPLTNMQNCYKNSKQNVHLENASFLSNNVLAIPFYPGITEEQIEKIFKIIE